MRQGERGNDFNNRPQRTGKSLDPRPAVTASHQYGREKQDHDKQYMVYSDGDMHNALIYELQRRQKPRQIIQVQGLFGVGSAEDKGGPLVIPANSSANTQKVTLITVS